MEFGEQCLHKLPTKGPRHDERGKLEERWRRGLFLGFARQSNEYVFWDEDKIVKARAHQRLRTELRWPAGAHEKVAADPHSTYAALLPERFGPGPAVPEPIETAPRRAGKAVAIRKADWERHGATPGCTKCSHALEHGWGFADGPHSAACVARYRELFMETEAGRLRVQRADNRRGKHEDAEGAVAAEPPRARVDGAEVAHPMIDSFLDRENRQADVPDGDDDLFARSEDEDMGAAAEDAEMDATKSSDIAAIEKAEFDVEVLSLIEQLGGSGRGYRRDRKKQLKAIISELYSPPRVTSAAKMLPSMKALPGYAFDLTTVDENGVAWDFDVPERREEAKRRILEQKPMLLVGSPMCTAFSTWQYLNAAKADPEKVKQAYARAMIHLQFSCEMYELQVAGGRYFLHEHPDKAMSWKEWCVTKVQDLEGVDRVTGDQCQYGQATSQGEPIRKPTGWMSNSECILNELGARCTGQGGACSRPDGGRHVQASGAVGKAAAIYPFALCRAILEGMKKQLKRDG